MAESYFKTWKFSIQASIDNGKPFQPQWRPGQPMVLDRAASTTYFNKQAADVALAPTKRLVSVAIGFEVQVFSFNKSLELEPAYSVKVYQELVIRVLFSPDSRYILAHTNTESILWDTHQINEQTLPSYDVQELASEALTAVESKTMAQSGWNSEQLHDSTLLELLEGAFRKAAIIHNRQKHAIFPGTFSDYPFDRSSNAVLIEPNQRAFVFESGSEAIRFKKYGVKIKWAEFSPDGSMIAVASEDQAIFVWGSEDGYILYMFQSVDARYGRGAFSPNSKLLAVAESRATIRVWNLETGSETFTFRGFHGLIYSLAFSPDSILLAGADEDGRVLVFDTEQGGPAKVSLTLNMDRREDSTMRNVRFCNDGREIAFRTPDGGLLVYDMQQRNMARIIPNAFDNLSAGYYDYSERFNIFVTCDADKAVRMWRFT
jgi:WD40 repeat protein